MVFQNSANYIFILNECFGDSVLVLKTVQQPNYCELNTCILIINLYKRLSIPPRISTYKHWKMWKNFICVYKSYYSYIYYVHIHIYCLHTQYVLICYIHTYLYIRRAICIFVQSTLQMSSMCELLQKSCLFTYWNINIWCPLQRNQFIKKIVC